MYIPPLFQQTDTDALVEFMRHNSFATLITVDNNTPFATHLPILVDDSNLDRILLRGHVARANPQWQNLAGDALVIFQGPNTYISPTWYEKSPNVPTWNYTAVHAYGQATVMEPELLAAALAELTTAYESGFEKPWEFASLPTDYYEKLSDAIVGIEIEVARLEGKYKLSQNRSEADRAGIIAALQLGDEEAQKVAHFMSALETT